MEQRPPMTAVAGQQRAHMNASSTQPDTTQLAGYVPTPAGWYHESCVHQIPPGAWVSIDWVVTLKDGTNYQIPKCLFPAYVTLPNHQRGQLPAASDTGWDEYDEAWSGSNTYRQLTAYWHVPPAPAHSYGTYRGSYEAYFTFPGIQNDSFILQPVLQYGITKAGGSDYHWELAAWHCDATGDYRCVYGNLVAASVGDSIIGGVTGEECANNTCMWNVLAWDVNSGATATLQVQDSDNYVYANGGVVETHGAFTSCDYFPAAYVYFTGISVSNRSGLTTPTWYNKPPTNPNPDCSFAVTSTTNTAMLYQNGPTLTSLSTNPSPPTQYQPFSLTVNGSYFNPDSAQLVYALEGCQGGCQQVIPNSALSGKTHNQLVESSLILDAPGTYDFQVRNSPTGPLSAVIQLGVNPSFSVTIDGPNPVPAHRYCTWDAMTSGGTAPYAYSWTVNGNPAGDGSDTLSITTPGSAFTIAVVATDANGLHASNQLSVSIGGSTCEY
ncbi:MAG: hypothetical protein ABR998_03575 [Gemmatimonadales bacterium]